MAVFETALRFVLENEGGLEENKDHLDSGGITKCGISFEFLKKIPEDRLKNYSIPIPVSALTVKLLTNEQISALYRGEIWDTALFLKIMNQALCNYIFDMCVNHGMDQGIKLTQRAIWACQKRRDFIRDDGILGSRTIQAINQCSFMLQVAMQAQRDGFYRRLVAVDPSRKEYLNGWLNRCYRV